MKFSVEKQNADERNLFVPGELMNKYTNWSYLRLEYLLRTCSESVRCRLSRLLGKEDPCIEQVYMQAEERREGGRRRSSPVVRRTTRP